MNILVTGYNSEIAKKLVEIIAERSDYQVIRCGRDDEANIEVDFSKHSSVHEFCKQIQKLKPQKIFVNHGVLPGKAALDYTEKEFIESNYINAVSTALIVESIFSLREISVLVTSSISGRRGSFDTTYAMQKAGLNILVKSAALRLHETSRINAIAPGVVHDTAMTRSRSDIDRLEQIKQSTPSHNFTSSEQVAELAYFLLFNDLNITGSIIDQNGGLYID